jgi:hypothetical protein
METLHHLATAIHGPAIIPLLVKAGVDVNAVNSHGQSALVCGLIQNGSIMQALARVYPQAGNLLTFAPPLSALIQLAVFVRQPHLGAPYQKGALLILCAIMILPTTVGPCCVLADRPSPTHSPPWSDAKMHHCGDWSAGDAHSTTSRQ